MDEEEATLGQWVWLLVFAVAVTVWRGYVLAILWNWFAAPVFGPSLTTWQAVGLTGMLGLVLPSAPRDTRPLAESVFVAAAEPAFFLFGGWVLHQFT